MNISEIYSKVSRGCVVVLFFMFLFFYVLGDTPIPDDLLPRGLKTPLPKPYATQMAIAYKTQLAIANERQQAIQNNTYQAIPDGTQMAVRMPDDFNDFIETYVAVPEETRYARLMKETPTPTKTQYPDWSSLLRPTTTALP